MTEWEYRVERLGAPPTKGDMGKFEELDETIQRKIVNVLSSPVGADHSTTGDLSRFGPDGWELVSTFPDAGSIVWVFRRKVE
jgi:hypothetical protein